MRKAQCSAALKIIRAQLEKLEQLADRLEERADDYEASVENIGEDSQTRLDAYREAVDYLRNGMITDAVDTLEALE